MAGSIPDLSESTFRNTLYGIMKTQKKTLGIVAAILVAATALLAYQLYQHRDTDSTTATEGMRTVTNEAFGFSFAFKEGPNDFTLVEPPEGQAGIEKAYILMPTKAYTEYKESTEAREAPAGINVFVMTFETEATEEFDTASTAERTDRMTRLKAWATERDNLTQFSQAKAEPEVIEIDGLKALKYETDGLYQQTTYLATYKNRVYMFVSQYNEKSDVTATAFDALLQSVSFD